MRHQKSGRRFNRDTNSRKALMRNLCTSLLESGRITTTEPKAKELKRWVERLITTAKDDDLNARRRVAEEISKPDVVERLFSNLLPRLSERPGGYTSIIHKGPRLGDVAPMVIIELVDQSLPRSAGEVARGAGGGESSPPRGGSEKQNLKSEYQSRAGVR